jgi:hypothetical protein
MLRPAFADAMGGAAQRQPSAMGRPLNPTTKDDFVKACREARADDYTNTIDNLEVPAPKHFPRRGRSKLGSVECTRGLSVGWQRSAALRSRCWKPRPLGASGVHEFCY